MNKNFFTAGRAVFTIQLPNGEHYTYRIKKSKATDKYAATFFIGLLTGPDNTSDYTYLGIMGEDGSVKLTGKSKYSDNSFPVRLLRRTLAVVFTDQQHLMTEKGYVLHHEGRCGRCGRALTVPRSVELGIGPECEGKL